MKSGGYIALLVVFLLASLLLPACCSAADPTILTPFPENTIPPHATPTSVPSLSESLAPVCQGNGVSTAAAFKPDHAPHLAFMIGSVPLDIPSGWLGASLLEIELVICLEEKEVFTSQCTYQDGSTIDRFKWVLAFSLVEARTGQPIQAWELDGEHPNACPVVVVTSGVPEHKQSHGEHPSPQAILPYLEPYILAGQILSDETSQFPFATNLTFSPDGSLLAGANMQVLFWDLSSGQVLHRFDRHSEFVEALAFSSDGNFLASGSYGGAVNIWDIERGECKKELAVTDYVGKLLFSPDDKLIAVEAITPLSLIAWQSGSTIRSLNDWVVSDKAFSPDGSHLAFIDYLGPWLLDLTDPASRPVMLGPERWESVDSFFVTFSPDGATLISALCLENGQAGQCAAGEINYWDVTSGSLLRTLPLPAVNVEDFIVLPGGTRLVSVKCSDTPFHCITSQIDIWDVETAQVVHSFHIHLEQGQVDVLAVSPNGSLLASGGSSDDIVIWNLSGLTVP